LITIFAVGTKIAPIPPTIVIDVGLIGIGQGQTVITGIAEAILIIVGLGLIGGIEAVIAGITEAIPIGIFLARIGDGRTVIGIGTDDILIGIVDRIIRTGITTIAQSIAILIGLIGIISFWTVVIQVAHPIFILIENDTHHERRIGRNQWPKPFVAVSLDFIGIAATITDHSVGKGMILDDRDFANVKKILVGWAKTVNFDQFYTFTLNFPPTYEDIVPNLLGS
jgi:hypothetical protein